MKKTLIALAVLAASCTTFAQVKITGTYAAGYQVDTAPGSDKSGLGVDTSLVTFTATEDLGGGLKATAVMSIDGVTRASVNGGDSSITLAGGFGAVVLETRKAPEFLSDDWVPMDERVFSKKLNSDSIAYRSPTVSGFNAIVAHNEDNPGVNLGVGAAGAPTGQRFNTLAVNYSAAALTASVGVRSYDQSGVTTTPTSDANNPRKTLLRAKMAYNFGTFKIGGGIAQMGLVSGSRADTLIGISVPLGAFTLVADVANRKVSDTNYADGSTNGYGLSATYALSKRTSIAALHASWDGSIGAASRSTRTSLLLSHSF
nr:porin [uncultured Rhodoferax sp.]